MVTMATMTKPLSEMTLAELTQADIALNREMSDDISPVSIERRSIASGFPVHVIEGRARERIPVYLRRRREIREEIDRRKATARHQHGRDCYDDAGPGAGGVSLVCGKIAGIDPE